MHTHSAPSSFNIHPRPSRHSLDNFIKNGLLLSLANSIEIRYNIFCTAELHVTRRQ
jgi:hypothetical protein